MGSMIPTTAAAMSSGMMNSLRISFTDGGSTTRPAPFASAAPPPARAASSNSFTASALTSDGIGNSLITLVGCYCNTIRDFFHETPF
jgi:hypothetical protein